MKLAQSARLRLFIAVAAAYIRRLNGQRAVYKPLFNGASYNSGGKLGAQGDRAPALIVKGIHLLLHNVGSIPHAAAEDLGVFKNRYSYLVKAVKAGGFKHFTLYKLPFIAVCR